MKNLTEAEKIAIKNLQKTATIWPDSLWLFSASGTLYVMKKNEDGNRVINRSGGADQSAVVATIKIENDGGDWH